MNRNWRYGGKAKPGSTAPDFDDSKFEQVTIPHTNQLLPWHSFDERDYQFVSIYRRHFRLPRQLEGRRVFVDFAGVMTAATVTINGQKLGEYRGGYTPFSFELTKHLDWKGNNVLAVEVDSTERADIPPFGENIDYLTFGGIYREVSLRFVGDVSIDNVFAKPVDVLRDSRRVDVRCFWNAASGSLPSGLKLKVELLDSGRVLAAADSDLAPAQDSHTVTLSSLGHVEFWDLDHPKLYDVTARLYQDQKLLDEVSTRTGFREARFTPEGFLLNG